MITNPNATPSGSSIDQIMKMTYPVRSRRRAGRLRVDSWGARQHRLCPDWDA